MNETASNKLKMPTGVSSTGPFVDMTEAYVKSVVAIPACLQALTEVVAEMSDSLSVLAIYLEKKGLAEGVLNNDDLDIGEEDGKSPTD